jgi:ubiquinone/menaquinone biosynthesis C-methylase UbiE
MPTIEWNVRKWADTYSWDRRGEEWSVAWGGSFSQWYTTIFPRIVQFTPVDSLVEIAPGFGRWTGFLLRLCSDYVGVDLSHRCVEHCAATFEKTHPQQTLRFVKNDGMTLPGVADASVDLVFSYDSLVHVEMDVLDAYLGEIARVLKPTGHGLLNK